MNKYKVLSLAFLLTFSIFTNAQQNKVANSDSEIVMTKSELKSFLKMVAEKRLEQLKKADAQNSEASVEVLGDNVYYRNNNREYRGGNGNGDLRRQIEKVNTRLDNLMLALIAGKGGNTVVTSSGVRPQDGAYIVNTDDNTSDQISNLERKLDSLKNVQHLNTSLVPTNEVEAKPACKKEPTKKCCAKKSEITPERRSALEQLLAKFKNFKRQVFFANNSYSVSKEDMKYLKRVTKVLKNNPELSVVLVGYASPVGNPEYNKQLSMKRAEAIAQVLVKEGVSKDRIIPAFHGEDHSTTEAKARRVDMTVVIK